jgi:Flp pilus assembly protein TadD
MLLTLGLALAGCATTAQDRQKSKSARDLGERFLRADDNTRALQQFLKALELNPDDPYLHFDLAYTYGLKGVTEKAEFHYKEAIRLKPDYSDAYNNLGLIYASTGRVDLAIESYEKALSNVLYLSPQFAHFNLGVAYLSLKEYHKAVEQFEEATRIIPDYAAAYVNLGRAYEGLYMDRQARQAYEKAVEFAPASPQAQISLGKLLYRTGDKRAATKAFKEVVRLAPESDLAKEAQSYLKYQK